MRRLLIAGILLVTAAPVFAEPKRLNVDFGFFPKGTTCQVNGTTGRVKLRIKKEIEFKIKGDTAGVSFFCQQPDGRQFKVDTAPLLPKGPTDRVAIQINQDNQAYVFWDDGGLRRKQVSGILKWQ